MLFPVQVTSYEPLTGAELPELGGCGTSAIERPAAEGPVIVAAGGQATPVSETVNRALWPGLRVA